MKKLTLSAVLWLYSGWYLGALVAAWLGLDPLLGPALGSALALFVTFDPFHLIWPTPLLPRTTDRPRLTSQTNQPNPA
jgi:hypothetical protein